MSTTVLPLPISLTVPQELDRPPEKELSLTRTLARKHYDPVQQVVVYPPDAPPEILNKGSKCNTCGCTFGCLDDETIQINDD